MLYICTLYSCYYHQQYVIVVGSSNSSLHASCMTCNNKILKAFMRVSFYIYLHIEVVRLVSSLGIFCVFLYALFVVCVWSLCLARAKMFNVHYKYASSRTTNSICIRNIFMDVVKKKKQKEDGKKGLPVGHITCM